MEQTVHIHKEFIFGRLAGLQQRATACKAWLGRVAREQAIEAMQGASRRPLAPR
ncbi:MAG: hypothetical protein J7515_08440 [Caulobacter sp.]|nr:hypothetical protein [Caulobacter sp.]